MSILRRGAVIATSALALSVVVGLGATSPSHAADHDGIIEQGPSAEFVLWRDSNFGSSIFDRSPRLSNFSGVTFVNSTRGLNDNASSTANYKTNKRVCAYTNAGYSGLSILHLPHGQIIGNTSYYYSSLGSFNDELSSFGTVTGSC